MRIVSMMVTWWMAVQQLAMSVSPEWGVIDSYLELDWFESLPPVKRLNRQQRQVLGRMFKEGDTDAFEETSLTLFQENDGSFDPEQLNAHVQSRMGKEFDYYTLVAEIFHNKPPVSRSILGRSSCEKIKGNLISIFAENIIVDGMIKDCHKNKANGETELFVVTELQKRHPIKVRLEPGLKNIYISRLRHAMGFREALQHKFLEPGQDVLVDQGPPGLDIGGQILSVIGMNLRDGMIQVQGGKLLLNISLAYSFNEGSDYQQYFETLKQGAASFWKLLGSANPNMDWKVAGSEMMKQLGRGQVPRSKLALGAMGAMCLARAFRLDFNQTTHKCEENIDSELIEDLPDEFTQVGQTASTGASLEVLGKAVIMEATSSAILWEGEPATLDRVLRIRAWFTELLEGVNADNFDSMVFLTQPGHDFLQEQREKEFQHEQHLLRRELRQRPDLLEKMVEQMLLHGALAKEDQDALGEAFPLAKTLLVDLASELQLSENWSSILHHVVQDALNENLVNSADMSSDEKKGPVVLNRILGMVEELESHIAKMSGKKLIFLVGDTGSGKSTTASHLMNIKLEEERGPMGRVWNHKNASGPLISPSWSASQTLYAECFEAADLGDSFALVDSPGFEDTRGDAYRMVTGLSLDRAVAAAACIPAIVLTVPHSFISEKRGQALLELLTKVRGRFPKILDPQQFDAGQTDQGLHIIVTKSNRPHLEQVRAIENGQFAREAHKHCSENLKRFESSPLDSYVLKEHIKLWRTLQLLAARKRIHVLNLGNKKQRKNLLQSFSERGLGRCTKPEYGTSFHDTQSQKILEVFVSVSAHTWRGFFGKLLTEYPQLIRLTEARSKQLQQEMIDMVQRRREQEKNLTAIVEKWQNLAAALDRGGHSDEDLADLVEEQTKEDVAEWKQSSSTCQRRLQKSHERLTKAKKEAHQVQRKIDRLQSSIRTWQTGERAVDLHSLDSAGFTGKIVGDCGDETPEKALEEVRQWNSQKCKKAQDMNVGTLTGTFQHFAHIPKEYRLVPADEEQRKRFQLDLSNEVAFHKTVARVSGDKYTLKGRNASPDGRTIAAIFDLHFDASRPYPNVHIVHQIPNIDFNEAKLRNADAELTDLLSKKARADKAHSSAQEEVENLEKQCADDVRKAEETLQAAKLKGVRQRLEIAEKHLKDFQGSPDTFHAEKVRLRNETSALMHELSDLHRHHAEVAFTVKANYQKVVPALVRMSEFVRELLTSSAVNKDVFQELDSFLEAHDEASRATSDTGGILAAAEEVLAHYRELASHSR